MVAPGMPLRFLSAPGQVPPGRHTSFRWHPIVGVKDVLSQDPNSSFSFMSFAGSEWPRVVKMKPATGSGYVTLTCY